MVEFDRLRQLVLVLLGTVEVCTTVVDCASGSDGAVVDDKVEEATREMPGTIRPSLE